MSLSLAAHSATTSLVAVIGVIVPPAAPTGATSGTTAVREQLLRDWDL
jgi:hypothetical protein